MLLSNRLPAQFIGSKQCGNSSFFFVFCFFYPAFPPFFIKLHSTRRRVKKFSFFHVTNNLEIHPCVISSPLASPPPPLPLLLRLQWNSIPRIVVSWSSYLLVRRLQHVALLSIRRTPVNSVTSAVIRLRDQKLLLFFLLPWPFLFSLCIFFHIRRSKE